MVTSPVHETMVPSSSLKSQLRSLSSKSDTGHLHASCLQPKPVPTSCNDRGCPLATARQLHIEYSKKMKTLTTQN